MFLHWKIRYLDRADKQFKDRNLYLNTRMLDPVTRAAVELVVDNEKLHRQREIVKYRHVFIEGTCPSEPRAPQNLDVTKGFCLHDYFEDEAGKEITLDEMAQILSGNPTARAIPPGARQHDIDLMLAEPKAVLLAEISLSSEEIRLLGIFVRDLQELLDSAFMKDGPGILCGGGPTRLQTAVTDDEIRSFVTIFRRLYMTSDRDPANFLSTVAIFVKALGDHPYSKWVDGTVNEYKARLAATPDARPFVSPGTCTFNTKRLIDVFIYTQYAHQPSREKQRQFESCLAQVQGKRDILTWMFLTEMWKLALEMGNAGRPIAEFLKYYCEHHKVSPDLLKSLRDYHAGLGTVEKEEDRRKRLFQEKVEQLAQTYGSRPVGLMVGRQSSLPTRESNSLRC